MARNKLTKEQKQALLTWLAADYDTALIVKWFEERSWPQLSRAAFTFYRKHYDIDITTMRKARRDSALNEGLALREERVKRLTQHADALEDIKWVPDDHGKLNNEKAWRETLADIAAEMGARKQVIDIPGEVVLNVIYKSKPDKAVTGDGDV